MFGVEASRCSAGDGDRILISRSFKKLERGDIVIFYYPEDPSKSYIKRITRMTRGAGDRYFETSFTEGLLASTTQQSEVERFPKNVLTPEHI